MSGIEEKISIVGADKAKRDLDQVANAQGRVGESVEDSGRKGKSAGKEFSVFDSVVKNIGASAVTMVGGFMGLQAVAKLAGEVIAQFERIDELQQKFFEKSMTLSDASARFSAQTGMGEEESIAAVSELAEAGGISFGAAESLGKTIDIVTGSSGGIRNEKNMNIAKTIAPFVGAKALEAGEVSELLNFLSTNEQLGSPEQLKEALAKLERTSSKSSAATVGAFAQQLNVNAAGFAAAGVSFEDQLKIAAQAIGANPQSAAQAAEAAKTLIAVASGSDEKFTKRINDFARSKGIDPKTMDRGTRIGLVREFIGNIDTKKEEDQFFKDVSSEKALRLLQSFGAKNVAAHQQAAEAGEAATIEDFEKPVKQYRKSVRYRAGAMRAGEDAVDAQIGIDVSPYRLAKEQAQRRVDRYRESGEIGWARDAMSTDEEILDHEIRDVLDEQVEALRQRGIDVREAEKLRPSHWEEIPFKGFSDSALKNYAITINNIGTMYQDREAGLHAPAEVDFSD